jgi:hypothetical protein
MRAGYDCDLTIVVKQFNLLFCAISARFVCVKLRESQSAPAQRTPTRNNLTLRRKVPFESVEAIAANTALAL